MIRILLLNELTALEADTVDKIISLMPDDRRLRALSYREKPRKENAACYALLLYGLARKTAVTFRYGENGKPYLENGCFFSFSHCDTGAVCALCDTEVGVDLQPDCEASEGVIKRVCSPSERQMLLSGGSFTRLWTQKECLLKLSGEGISGFSGLPDLSGCTEDGTVYELGKISLVTYRVEKAVLSVCGYEGEVEIKEVSADELRDFFETVD